MSDHALTSDSRRRFGELLPHHLPDGPQSPPPVHLSAFPFRAYAVLATVSSGFPPPVGRLLRVTHSFATVRVINFSEESFLSLLVQLACVRHAASVHPEPGSNPPSNIFSRLCSFAISFRLSCLSVTVSSVPFSKYLGLTVVLVVYVFSIIQQSLFLILAGLSIVVRFSMTLPFGEAKRL